MKTLIFVALWLILESNKKSKAKAKPEKATRKTPTSRRKLKTFLSEDSDDEETTKPEGLESDQRSDEKAKSKAPLKQSTKKLRQSFLNSSSEDETPNSPKSQGNQNQEVNLNGDNSGSESDVSPIKVKSSTKRLFERDSSDDDSNSGLKTNDQATDKGKHLLTRPVYH
jgi:hypothetical protein